MVCITARVTGSEYGRGVELAAGGQTIAVRTAQQTRILANFMQDVLTNQEPRDLDIPLASKPEGSTWKVSLGVIEQGGQPHLLVHFHNLEFLSGKPGIKLTPDEARRSIEEMLHAADVIEGMVA